MWFALLAPFVTVSAIDGAILAGFEGNLGLLTTIGADGIVHLAGAALAAIPRLGETSIRAGAASTGTTSLPCRSTVRATLGLGKAALLIERLLTRGEDERAAAVGTVQYTILKL
jgi:hypothetical protein